MLETGQTLEASHLLVAAGRRANIAGLALEKARITASVRGITTDERLRTSNRRVFAIGDVAGRHQFTHIAGYHASIVIRNMLFKLPAKLDNRAVPWVTYTDPELAHTGMSKADAEAQYGAPALKITDWPFSQNDRARAERKTSGMVRVITDKRGRILGASILAPHAGEMIHSWTLAINAGLNISAMANAIAPYPSWSEASKRAAGAWFTETLFAERTKKLVRFLLMFQKRG
jgi:pyruvate/2-oxoglutarate dehydrogenase complex dihydrolipoamide dehydrogenase (E3) component